MTRPFLTAEWRHLAMLNYEVDAATLEPYLPHGVELDSWHGRHFTSIVGFMFHRTKVLGFPIPFHRRFAEVNLRFYVRRKVENEWRRGVVFIREVAPKRMVCWIARKVYNEQYCRCRMRQSLRLPDGGVGRVSYGWRWTGGTIDLTAEFDGEPKLPTPGSIEEFIAEHYWAYTRQRDGSTSEYHVTHRPWRIWDAKTWQVDGNAAGFYGEQFSRIFSAPPVSAFVADGSPVEVFPARRMLE